MATVISEISRLLVVPVPVKEPLVAPVTEMLSTVKLTGSAEKVSVRDVVVEEFEAPPTWVTLEKVTAISEGASVAGNTALTTPELALLETGVAPATVKKFAATPVRVWSALAVRVIVAV